MAQLVIPEFKGEWSFLSNFYAHEQTFNTAGEALRMPTAEHIFQACKYKAMDLDDEVKIAYVVRMAGMSTPAKARALGKTAKRLDIEAWDAMKIGVMREVLLNKFSTKEMEMLLLSTGDAMLVEGNNHGDQFWGRSDKKGYNILGVILMELRGYFRYCNRDWPVSNRELDLPPY